MTKQVRCISPHGGCHNGMTGDGPVHRLPGGELPDIDPARLLLPPNPGGWRDDTRIPGRYAAVGRVYEVDDSFYADGFHWEDVAAPLPGQPLAPGVPAEGN
jgi:hypothetical protein